MIGLSGGSSLILILPQEGKELDDILSDGALLQDTGLEQYGMKLVAGFDVRKDMIGRRINDIPIYDVADFAKVQREKKINIGILTVPVERAQATADLMTAGGIKAIWNFTPYRIRVAKGIVVQNTSIYAHLAVMFNRLNELNRDAE